MTHYDVRYLINGEERQDVIDAETAAHAAEAARHANASQDEVFELIQVSPQDDPSADDSTTAVEQQ